MMPLQDLMQNDPVEETTQAEAEQDTRRHGEFRFSDGLGCKHLSSFLENSFLVYDILRSGVIVRYLAGDDPEQVDRVWAVIGHTPVFVPRTVLLEVEWVLRGV